MTQIDSDLVHDEIVALIAAASRIDPMIEDAVDRIEYFLSRSDCSPQAGEWLNEILVILLRSARTHK
jgi:hypothetical protein